MPDPRALGLLTPAGNRGTPLSAKGKIGRLPNGEKIRETEEAITRLSENLGRVN